MKLYAGLVARGTRLRLTDVCPAIGYPSRQPAYRPRGQGLISSGGPVEKFM